MTQPDTHADVTGRVERALIDAIRHLRFYRPDDFVSPDVLEAKKRELHSIGDMRTVFVNQGDWGLIEMLLADLSRAPATHADVTGDEQESVMNAEQIKHMVDRFLGWRLPENFAPDNGISYTRPNYHPTVDATPTGTNLFDAAQATAMVRHMLEGLPEAATPDPRIDAAVAEKTFDPEYERDRATRIMARNTGEQRARSEKEAR
jgi:hypothetical protein